MHESEYRLLQDELSNKIKHNPYRSKGLAKYEEGYKNGILAAKSILHSYFIFHNKNEADQLFEKALSAMKEAQK